MTLLDHSTIYRSYGAGRIYRVLGSGDLVLGAWGKLFSVIRIVKVDVFYEFEIFNIVS